MSWINRLLDSLRKNKLEDQLDDEQRSTSRCGLRSSSPPDDAGRSSVPSRAPFRKSSAPEGNDARCGHRRLAGNVGAGLARWRSDAGEESRLHNYCVGDAGTRHWCRHGDFFDGPLALASTRLIHNQRFGLEPNDPVTICAATTDVGGLRTSRIPTRAPRVTHRSDGRRRLRLTTCA
jgi:hypothetical protein